MATSNDNILSQPNSRSNVPSNEKQPNKTSTTEKDLSFNFKESSEIENQNSEATLTPDAQESFLIKKSLTFHPSLTMIRQFSKHDSVNKLLEKVEEIKYFDRGAGEKPEEQQAEKHSNGVRHQPYDNEVPYNEDSRDEVLSEPRKCKCAAKKLMKAKTNKEE